MYIELNTLMYVFAASICAALVAYSMTPPVRALAYKIGAIDVPQDERRMHTKPIPRIGGLAIFAGFILSSAIFCQYSRTLYAIWVGGSILIIVGILDDIYRISALMKLAAQIVAAVGAVICDVTISHISLFGNVVVLGVWEIPVTIIWIVGLTNAINLIDGLDGLACGISAICSASIACVMLLAGDPESALLTIILTAACTGFLPFNKNPARIFMGDTGALFLGYSLAVISSTGLFKLHTVISFLVPITVFALPLFDTINAIIRRILSGRNPFSPDRGHLHHKLVDMGFSQKETVRILYSICALMGLVAVVFTDTMFNTSRLVKALILLFVAVVILYVNFLVMVNPHSRLHLGLFDEDSKDYEMLCRKLDDSKKKENSDVAKEADSKETEKESGSNE